MLGPWPSKQKSVTMHLATTPYTLEALHLKPSPAILVSMFEIFCKLRDFAHHTSNHILVVVAMILSMNVVGWARMKSDPETAHMDIAVL